MSINIILRRITRPDFERSHREGLLCAEHTEEIEEISKAWDELQRILADGDMDHPPLEAQALCGGEVLPNDDMDYGGVRLIAPGQVAEISRALIELTDEEFQRRYETADLTGAYSSGEGGRPGRPLADLQKLVDELRRFYADAASSNEAVGYWYG
ncbi:DUF1877 family protein [Catellatospora sp. NPDC049133]|uniref:DUF1877 family protein n=1 Tax=Catellatospora sp. NPDC049133 TaxID=3155499 RepID=UPI0033D4205F